MNEKTALRMEKQNQRRRCYEEGDSTALRIYIHRLRSEKVKSTSAAYAKSVIYLYPRGGNVGLNGKLTDAEGSASYCLFWESVCDLSGGFAVAGEDTEAFLEDTLAQLGLNARSQ